MRNDVTPTFRTVLFAPGNEPRKLARLDSLGADVVVVDLEDAVADAEKDAARVSARAALETFAAEQSAALRVNGLLTGRLEDDIRVCACPALDTVIVPKVEDSDVLEDVNALLESIENDLGLAAGHFRLLPIVETARGLARVDDIAMGAPPRVPTLIFGTGDFSTDIGVDLTSDGLELLYGRSRFVVAARAAGLLPPIDGPYLDLRDLDGLTVDSRRSRQLGFQGRVIVHPRQLAPVRIAYSELSPSERAECEAVVAAFEQAEATGVASIQVNGRFVDYPIYHRAKRRLAVAND